MVISLFKNLNEIPKLLEYFGKILRAFNFAAKENKNRQ